MIRKNNPHQIMQALNGRGDKRTAKGKRFSKSNGKVFFYTNIAINRMSDVS